ncbi:putative molybdenum cofactor guanylyltransferase [bacterium HR07]|nr:putative molybdenum cofactor guanylyltransferase [bacterium HR07]
MGRDKALLPWQGHTLIEHLVARLTDVSDDVLVITGRARRYLDLVSVPVLADEIINIGPMGGLYTGLKHARYEYSLVVACDMPLLSRALIDMLKSELDGSVMAVVPEVRAHRVPTLAIYHKRCLGVIEHLLAHGRTSLQALLDSVPTKIVAETHLRAVDPTLRSFANINTPEDWKECADA